MICPDTTPSDGPGWADLAECLESRDLHEAAARAWRHAWEVDPTLADRALPAALALAHQTGDDTLVVEIAGSLPEVTDVDVAGHLALARAIPGAADERELLLSVSDESCRHPYAQYRLASLHWGYGKLKSQVMALRNVVLGSRAEGWVLGRAPLWETWALADAAVLQVVSVFGHLERPPQVLEYVEDRPRNDPYAAYTRAWAAVSSADPQGALDDARFAAETLPEASVVLVVAREQAEGDGDQAASEAHAHWDPVRDAIAAWLVVNADHPETARDALDDLDLPPGVLAAVGGMGPMSTLWVRSFTIDREARRARNNPVVAALVDEAEQALDAGFGAAILDAVSHGAERIDLAMVAVDAAADGDDAVPYHFWSPEDFGW